MCCRSNVILQTNLHCKYIEFSEMCKDVKANNVSIPIRTAKAG